MGASQIYWWPRQQQEPVAGAHDMDHLAMAYKQNHVCPTNSVCGRAKLLIQTELCLQQGLHSSDGSPHSSCSVSAEASHCASQAAEQCRL